MLSVYLSMAETDDDSDKIAYIYNSFYSSMAYSVKNVLGNNAFDVDDVVHEAMLRIIELLPQIDFSDPGKVKYLCCTIAKNQAVDHQRQKENQNVSIEDAIAKEAGNESCPIEIIIKKETYGEILNAIYSLDDKYKDVCILKYMYKMKEKDIAAALGLPVGTVGVRIRRGR